MLDQETGSTITPPELPHASMWRVVVVSVALLAAPVIVAYLIVLASRGTGFSVEGFGAFLGISVLWCFGGAVLIRLGRVRSVWLGILFMLGPALGSILVQGSAPGALVSLGIGALAGLLGIRGRRMLLVPQRGYAVMLVIGLLATIATAALAEGSPEQALRATFNDEVLARYEAPGGDEVFMLVPSNTFPASGRYVYLVHAQREGRRWVLTPAGGQFDRAYPGDAGRRELPVPDSFGFSSSDSALTLPTDCARPRVYVVPALEVEGNCWLQNLGLVAGVAPGRSRTLEITMRDGSVVRRPVRKIKGFGPGFIVPYFARAGVELPHSRQPFRIAFRDAGGALLDARPSMRFSYDWYQAIASTFRVQVCRAGSPGSYRCSSTEPIPPSDRIHRLLESISLLRPAEYQTICKEEPPAGDWVALARVDTDPQHLFLDHEVSRTFTGKKVTYVAVGVDVDDGEPGQWLRMKTAQVGGRPCFPGSDSEPDLYGSD